MFGTLPSWWLRRFAHPRGQRLPAKVKTFGARAPHLVPLRGASHVPRLHDPWAGRNRRRPWDDVEDELEGNLDQAQYQFYVGSASKTTGWSMCRYCRKTFYKEQDRRKHFREDKGNDACSVRTIAIMLMLVKDMKCVVCDSSTKHTKWGFPICLNVDCFKRWMFIPNETPAWSEAKRLLQERGWVRGGGTP